MKYVALVAGSLAILLGGLWLVQGLGLVTIAPILCVADCEPLQGPSTGWAIAGGALVVAGAAAVAYGVRRWRARRRS